MNQIHLIENPHILKKWRHWHYKNTSLLILSFGLFFYLADTPQVDNLITRIGGLGYLGAFISGVFFVSVFTVAPAAVVLFHLAEQLHPIEVALLAGVGGVVGDYLILHIMKDKVFKELLPIIKKLKVKKISLFFKSPYFAWLLPVMGAVVVASPLPDEIGVSMLGLSKIKKWQFIALTFVLNAVGILLIVLAAQA